MRISDWSSDVCSSDLMARAAGVDVIVVDHHKCAAALPVAHALVNPNRLDESDVGVAHGHLAAVGVAFLLGAALRSEEHTSELQSLMRISYAVFCLKKKKRQRKSKNCIPAQPYEQYTDS